MFSGKARLALPVTGAAGLVKLLLREMERLQSRVGQKVKTQDQSSLALDLLFSGHQTAARTAGQQWDARMNAEQLQDLGGFREKLRSHEYQAEGNTRRLQLTSKLLGPTLQASLVELAGPMCGH